MNSPFLMYETCPVSSLTTKATASVFSVTPMAALCRRPKRSGIFFS